MVLGVPIHKHIRVVLFCEKSFYGTVIVYAFKINFGTL